MGMFSMKGPWPGPPPSRCGERDCKCGSGQTVAHAGNREAESTPLQTKPLVSTDWEPRDFRIDIRTRQFLGVSYIRLEDVAAMFLEFGDCSGSRFIQARSKKLAQDILRMGRE